MNGDTSRAGESGPGPDRSLRSEEVLLLPQPPALAVDRMSTRQLWNALHSRLADIHSGALQGVPRSMFVHHAQQAALIARELELRGTQLSLEDVPLAARVRTPSWRDGLR